MSFKMKLTESDRSKLHISTAMIILAVLALATGTFAWFSISLSGRVNTMDLQVTAGDYLRVDVRDRGNNIENWPSSLVEAGDIEDQLGRELEEYELMPVTSGNGEDFYTRRGTEVDEDRLSYLQFDLYFISNKDVNVYLTEEDSSAGNDGTRVSSDNSNDDGQADVVDCVRISFDPPSGSTKIYEPSGESNTRLTVDEAISDGGSRQSTFSDARVGDSDSLLFSLDANVSKRITVTIWIEGDDEQCDNDIELSKFQTRLRFEGELIN